MATTRGKQRRPARELEMIRSEIRADAALRLETVAGELGLPEPVAEDGDA